MEIRALIIEDEHRNQLILKQLLEEHCPNITILGYAKTVGDGIYQIRSQKPDLVFMDIQLQDGTGFDIMSQVTDHLPHYIFTTAYDQYAIKAFKFSAVDYLLKPIIGMELSNAVDKVIQKNKQETQISIHALLKNIKQSTDEMMISVPSLKSVDYLKVTELIRIEASGAYSKLIVQDDKVYIVSKVIKEYELLLSDHHFFRVHQSYLVNLKKIKKYIKGEQIVVMDDGTQIPVARNRKDAFTAAVDHLLLK